MGVIFIHLSDIHFGQESGGHVTINNDVKARLVDDVRAQIAALTPQKAMGIIVTGDISQSAQKEQYKSAGEWLDSIAKAAGCEITNIQLVPGNHDIDHNEISPSTKWMLEQIAEHGDAKLDEFLASEIDREVLYKRFAAYRTFAEAYNSPLDKEGGVIGDRTFPLNKNRSLRFVGLNSALICSKNSHEEGKLLLGARQRVLPVHSGEELIVLAHHPLHWLQDSEEAARYIKTRARVFITGHEHNPAVKVEELPNNCDLMLLAAGATVAPPGSKQSYTYNYNIIEFEWDEVSDNLSVKVCPRVWSDDIKNFQADIEALGGKDPTFILRCPVLNNSVAIATQEVGSSVQQESTVNICLEVATKVIKVETGVHMGKDGEITAQHSLLLLRFFRDLSSGQRLSVLVKLGILPDDCPEPLTNALERRLIDELAREGSLDALEKVINEIQQA